MAMLIQQLSARKRRHARRAWAGLVLSIRRGRIAPDVRSGGGRETPMPTTATASKLLRPSAVRQSGESRRRGRRWLALAGFRFVPLGCASASASPSIGAVWSARAATCPAARSQPTRAHTAGRVGTRGGPNQPAHHAPSASVRPRPKNTRAPTGPSYPSPGSQPCAGRPAPASSEPTAPEPSRGPRRATPARGHVVHVPMPFPGGRSARWPRPERGRGRVAWQGQRR